MSSSETRLQPLLMSVGVFVVTVASVLAAAVVARTYGQSGTTIGAGALVATGASLRTRGSQPEPGAPGTTVATVPPATTTSSPPAPPEGAALAFQRERTIWVSEADGTGARQLTTPRNEESWYRPLAWLPDGRLLGAFSDSPVGVTERFETVTLDGERQEFHHMSVEPGDIRVSAETASVSPDGTRVAVVVQHGIECGQCIDRSVVVVKSLEPEGRVLGEMRFEVDGDDLTRGMDPVRRVAFDTDSRSLYVLFQSDVIDGDTTRRGRLFRYGPDQLGSAAPRGIEVAGDLVDAVALAPTGDLAMAAGGRILLRQPNGHEAELGDGAFTVDLAFSPDGTYLYRMNADPWESPPDIARIPLSNPAGAEPVALDAGFPVPWRAPHSAATGGASDDG